MTNDTYPTKVVGPGDGLPVGWQSPENFAWSFGSTEKTLLRGYPEPLSGQMSDSRVGNVQGNSTTTPEASPPRRKEAGVPRLRSFGKRSSTPLGHWEGIVDRVTDDGFSAIIVPFKYGTPDRTSVEFAEFQLDELADRSDIHLVAEGAVFYWTVARTTNAAGTVSNESLVRFRRLPPVSARRMAEADREALEIFESLGGGS